MNVRTALISSALLVAVLGWACEQGPTSPSTLGTPGGGQPGRGRGQPGRRRRGYLGSEEDLPRRSPMQRPPALRYHYHEHAEPHFLRQTHDQRAQRRTCCEGR